MNHVKWPRIGQFHTVRKTVNHWASDALKRGEQFSFPRVQYGCKVKLDGTNAGIRIVRNDDDEFEFAAQSRSRVITPEGDNYGFATWVYANEKWVVQVAKRCLFGELKDILVFGEWAGPGVQKRTSVSKIERRMFFVFGVILNPESDDPFLVYKPWDIEDGLVEHPDVCVIPFMESWPTAYFGEDKPVADFINATNDIVEWVEKCDPFVKKTFGIEGLGEGIVCYPMVSDYTMGHYFNLMFKAKGTEHEEVKKPKPVMKDPAVAASIQDFAEMTTTVARCEKGVAEACGGEVDVKKTGAFLKWIGNDIKSECVAELEAAGLEWKQVGKAVGNVARMWWLKKVSE